MKKYTLISFIINLLLLSIIVSSFALILYNTYTLFAIIPAFLLLNAFAGFVGIKTSKTRLKVCHHGAVLLSIFEGSIVLTVIYHIVLAFFVIPDDYMTLVWSALLCFGLELIVFWNGIICIYLTSVQLGIKQRIIGALCGMLPIVNLIVLNGMLKTVFTEIYVETEKEQLNDRRKDEKICQTKFPLLFVHGVFFRDTEYFNYWGRIPAELELNGAKVYYGNHQSAASIEDSAIELTDRIMAIVEETGCEKVNVIAHSKGGLDCRYAIAKLGVGEHVASLTTVNTPHRGCVFADQLLTTIPESLKNKVATAYNTTLKQFGDANPDFIAAVSELTASFCEKFNEQIPTPEDVFCQSIGSTLKTATSGKFPLNLSYHLVKYFDGPNDGLVSESSFGWGEKYIHVTSPKNRGVSHGDMIDLNRENIAGFDVREFYVSLVSDLKNRGL